MLPYYDYKLAKQDYQERLQAAEEERLALALLRQQSSILKSFAGAIQVFIAAHLPAPLGARAAARRV